MIKIFFTVILCIVIQPTSSGKILAVFPFPSISHQVVFQTLIKKLVSLGHDVTVITPNPAYKQEDAPSNIKEIDVHDISYKIYQEAFLSQPHKKISDKYELMKILLKVCTDVFEAQMLNEEVQNIINEVNSNFDLILIEAFLKIALGFSHIFKVPIVQISSLGATPYNNQACGVSTHPFLFPSFLYQRIYNLTIFEKISEIYTNEWLIKNLRKEQEIEDHKTLKRIFGQDTPNVDELNRNIDMLLVNVQPIYVDNQPWPLNVVFMGGMHLKPTKSLPQDLQIFLDSSKHGVIYFSMGTNVKMSLFPSKTLATFKKSFSDLPYDVLWKWDDEELPEKSPNIKISKWFPQSDLLAHPKIKLFITQGGLQSTEEAINAGVPLIGLPMLADQWYNVEKYVYHKIGIQLDVATLTKEDLINAITTITSNKSYRENVLRLRTFMQDHKQLPLERAVQWIEYVLRQGGAKHMRAGAANLSWSDYYEIEIVAIVFVFIFILLLLFTLLVYFITKYFIGPYINQNKIKLP